MQRKSAEAEAQHTAPPPPFPYGRYLDEGPRMTLKTAEALPRVHWYPLVPRSSRRHQSQQEPMQEPADKQAHATSGSTGEGGVGLGGGCPYRMWLSLRYPSETLGSQGKHHRIYMWTLRKRGRAPQIPTGCGRVSPGKGGQLQPEEPCPGLRAPLHIRLGALRNTSGSQTNKEGRDAAFTTRVHRAAIISRTHRSHFSPRSASSTELFFSTSWDRLKSTSGRVFFYSQPFSGVRPLRESTTCMMFPYLDGWV